MLLLTIENLSHSYGERILFKNVNFNIETGDKIGLIGINGTGKSTLLRHIAEMDGGRDPETGEPVPRHRRRSDNRPAEPEEAAQPTEVVEKVEEKTEEEPPREPVRQAADSRVPPEARRMAASPYHAVSPVSAAKRSKGSAEPVGDYGF